MSRKSSRGATRKKGSSVNEKYSAAAAGGKDDDDSAPCGGGSDYEELEQWAQPQIDLNNLKQEIFLKLLVLGDLGVGKTSLVRKYTEDGLDSGGGGGGGGGAIGGGAGGAGGGYKVSIAAGFNLKRFEVRVDGKVSKKCRLKYVIYAI
jgi:hypothetical protein